MKFTLEVKLGNDAMQLPEDVAWMLRKTADEVVRRYGELVVGCGFSLQDDNGNTCAKVTVDD